MPDKTALQQLKEKLQTVVDDLKDAIPGTDQYGYRDAMRNVILDIDMQMIPAERDAIVEAVNETSKNCVNIANNVVQLISPRKIKLFEHSGLEGEQYYETRYGK